jgi:hypothetical protein
MGVDFALEFEPRTLAAPSEARLQAYHRQHVPGGAPPLEAIREHLAHAVAVADAGPDGLEALHSAWVDAYGRDRFWLDLSLRTVAQALGLTPLEHFQVAAPGWCQADDGLRTVRGLHAHLTREHPDWTETLDCLRQVEAMLEVAAREGRGFRLLAMW